MAQQVQKFIEIEGIIAVWYPNWSRKQSGLAEVILLEKVITFSWRNTRKNESFVSWKRQEDNWAIY